MNPETREKLEELQTIEQNINSMISQKQQFQAQEIELGNALSELKDTEEVFRIVGNIMVKSDKDKVKEDLDQKKELVTIRLKSLSNQEEKLRKKASELQEIVIKDMK